jgi:hypothetical protein
MSFLTTIPEELIAAATKLEGIGSSLAAQNAAAAAPTTTIAPAAADQVSTIQAALFGGYGTIYQQLAAEAHTIQQQFLSTLGLSSGTYSETEAANAAASGNPISNFLDSLSLLFGGSGTGTTNPLSFSGNSANFISFESGNWASAMSDVIGMAGGGLIPSDWLSGGAAAAGDAAAAATASNVTPLAGLGGMGAMPMVGALGQATMVGKLSVPPSWASVLPTAGAASPIQTVGWTAAAPQAAPGTFVPGVPGLASAARNSAGFGAPRYGVKPIVMPKLATV